MLLIFFHFGQYFSYWNIRISWGKNSWSFPSLPFGSGRKCNHFSYWQKCYCTTVLQCPCSLVSWRPCSSVRCVQVLAYFAFWWITNLPAQRAIVSTCYIMFFFAFVPCHVAAELRPSVFACLLFVEVGSHVRCPFKWLWVGMGNSNQRWFDCKIWTSCMSQWHFLALV